MILKNIIRIYKIGIFIGCFTYSYHLGSIYGGIYFSMASIAWGITSYNEGGEINNSLKNIIILTYIIGLVSGSFFIFDIPSDPNGFSSSKTLIISISLIIFIFTLVNIINLFINGKSGFIELNNKFLRSKLSIEQEEQKHDLDEFVQKYKNKKKNKLGLCATLLMDL